MDQTSPIILIEMLYMNCHKNLILSDTINQINDIHNACKDRRVKSNINRKIQAMHAE